MIYSLIIVWYHMSQHAVTGQSINISSHFYHKSQFSFVGHSINIITQVPIFLKFQVTNMFFQVIYMH